jgi:ABC-2 type transport system ATP-binding protein
MNVADAAIQTAGLSKTFGATVALAGADLAVERGRMHGLIGPDGAGKTTLIRLLCGILRPTAGSARVLGMDLAAQRRAIKRRIGYLSQRFTLYGDLSVDENVAFFAEVHGVRDYARRRTELLDLMRLTPFRTRLADRLSGGMKKKLALACTLIHTPDLLLLDEPSTGVDPVSRGEFWNILSDVMGRGMTLLLTTPYLDEAERCDRVSLMYRGRVVGSGEPSAIRAAMPGAMYDLIGAGGPAAYRVARERWSVSRLTVSGDRLRLWASDDAAAHEATQWLGGRIGSPVRAERCATNLEDAFVALAGAEGPAGGDHEPKGA